MNFKTYCESASEDANFCPVTNYALDVLESKILTGIPVRQACQRHIDDLERSFDGNLEYEFSRDRANHVFKFFEVYCKHSKGEWAGQPVTLEPWQKFIVGSLMGWVHQVRETRRFTLSYTQIARKQGKSLLSSGLMLYLFMIDNEPGAEVYCASIKRDTAKIVWTDAMRMVKASPMLRKHVKVQESFATMKYKDNSLKALSADSGQDGLNIHGFSLDEYHLLPTNSMYEVLVSGMQARRNPLGFIITTAGESKGGTTPCYNLYEYGKQVLKGILQNENFFFYIAEMQPEEIHDPDNWIKSNPNLGVSVQLEALEQAYLRAKDGGEMDNFMIKHMNLWIQRKDAYFPLDRWDDNKLPDLIGRECYIGVDLSSKLDLTSVSAVFPMDDGTFAVLNHNFMPADSLSGKERIDKVPYARWAKEGHLTLTSGEVVDVEFVFEYIKELATKYDIVNIGLDPWNATSLMTMLDNDGFTVHEVRQGYKSLSEAIKFTKELLIQRKLQHGNNPILRWCVANAVPVFDANENVVLSKAKSINRIDAIASTVTAMTQAMQHGNIDSLERHIDENYKIW